jgi:hypothetical protein
MKTQIERAQELINILGNGQIHTMTMRRALKTRKSSTLVGVKESTTQIRAVGYENTAKVKALRESGVERSEIPSGYVPEEGFGGKVLRNERSGRLHLNVGVVESGNGSSKVLVDGQEVSIESIADELLSSETRKRDRDPEAQRWMRPAVENIIGIV